MPAATVPKNALALGAGYLYYAALGSSLPTYTVVGSVFTDAWPGAWFLLGVTKNGHEMTYDLNTDTIDSAEYLDPLAYVTTGRAAGMKFELMQVHATNMKRALNGGTLTTSGAGTTLRSTYVPPAIGAEVRCMLGWEGTDNTERVIAEQCFQIGTLSIARRKGADNATLPVEFRFEIPGSGNPFQYDTAGTLRG
jgi:hypothetical protein